VARNTCQGGAVWRLKDFEGASPRAVKKAYAEGGAGVNEKLRVVLGKAVLKHKKRKSKINYGARENNDFRGGRKCLDAAMYKKRRGELGRNPSEGFNKTDKRIGQNSLREKARKGPEFDPEV